MPFVSARRDIIRHRFSLRRRSSSCLLAPSPLTVGSGGSRAYLLGYQSAPFVPLPFAPPHRHGERGERRGGLLSCLMWMSGLPIPSIVLDKGTAAISFCVLSLWIVWIACPSSYDCRAIPRRSMRVVMGSGLGRVRLSPRLLCIPCGFVSFHQLPRPVAPCRLIRPVPLLDSPSSPR